VKEEKATGISSGMADMAKVNPNNRLAATLLL
jgi:hypothetical protein